MNHPRTTFKISVLGLWILSVPAGAAQPGPLSVDFRYSPPWWQTSICLPDDWQKTLVGKDGSLLYDYPGKHRGFKTRILVSLDVDGQNAGWVSQELASPRVPIVRTLKRAGGVDLLEEAFAVAPPLPAGPSPATAGSLAVERVGPQPGLADWASPAVACDPAFRSVAVGWNEPVRYRFRAAGQPCRVFLGLCEGYHREAGRRILDLSVEGEKKDHVDLVALKGPNVPAVFPLKAQDLDGDGWIDVSVSASPGSKDTNPILNALWVFRQADDPSPEDVLSGRASGQALASVDCGDEPWAGSPPRNDVLILRLRNGGPREASVTPLVLIESELPVSTEAKARRARIGPATTLTSTSPFEAGPKEAGRAMLRLSPMMLRAGEEKVIALGVARGSNAAPAPCDPGEADRLRRAAEGFWRQAPLPYERLEVPDPAIQAQIDSSIRNIYQAREIKNGRPAFQVGPTCYRGLWVVDGSFLLEAMTFLGRADEARSGLHYLLDFQRDDGAIMLINGHWKETGIALWAAARHARLTGDRAWLAGVWPKIEKGFAYIMKMRQTASASPGAPNAGLIPEGFSDGGLGGSYPEYTNVYWTMVGLKAAVEAARWLHNDRQAEEWSREYLSFLDRFRQAAERDARVDSHGNRYVPIRMRDDQNVAPQKAQWAFLHAVFPGQVFARDDPLVLGNMAMLEAAEAEDLVCGTGWLSEGIWGYFASFYGHAWLWLGHGQKAARTLYAFANHASPLLAWREEQSLAGKGEEICGDMPHNWASAEFIRLVRNLLVLERPGQGAGELHLLEGLPREWVGPGAVTRLNGILTEFGPVTLELRVAGDGSSAHLRLDSPLRSKPSRIVLHLDGWSSETGTVELPVEGHVEKEVRIRG